MTTSNVVPTALRYTGPLICLNPPTEVAPMIVEHRTRGQTMAHHFEQEEEAVKLFLDLQPLEGIPFGRDGRKEE